MRRLICTAWLVYFSISAAAQNDSLKKEILNYAEPKGVVISKGRMLLQDKLLAGDFKKVKEIKDYLAGEVANEDYAAFLPLEYWLIQYWTGEYEPLLQSLQNLDSVRMSMQAKIRPQQDLLAAKLLGYTKENLWVVQAFIKEAALKPVDKDFLLLNLPYLVREPDDKVITQEALNEQADQFLQKYPASVHDIYVRQYIRQKYVPSKWAFTFEFFTGYASVGGNLSQYFQHNIPIGHAFDVYYKNVALYLRNYIGFSKTRTDMVYAGATWPKDAQVRVYLPEAAIGYVAVDNKRLKLAPFAGIASASFSPTEYDVNKNPNLEDAGLPFTTTYTLGLNTDIKVGKFKAPVVSYGREESYGFVRMRYAAAFPQFKKKNQDFSGNMHYVTVGFGGFGRRLKRSN